MIVTLCTLRVLGSSGPLRRPGPAVAQSRELTLRPDAEFGAVDDDFCLGHAQDVNVADLA